MTTDDVYQFFGSGWKSSRAIGIAKQTFSNWIERGFIPMKQQKRIEKITKGKLVALEEDAKKPTQEKKELDANYLPNFRYFDKKHGMCKVESLHFRKGKLPKITYVVEGNKKEKFAVFDAKNLMQASELIDSQGKILYEGDIVEFVNGERVVFKSIRDVNKFKKLGKFKITGNIFQ